MKKPSFYLFLLVALTMAFGACKKDDDKSNSEKLVDKNWNLVSLTSDPAINFGGVSITDLYAQLDACNKDDLTIFKTGGTVNYDEGATKCDPSDPQTTTGIWLLNSDQTIITIDGDSWTILELNDSQLKVKFTTDFFGNGVNTTLTATFQKK